MTATPPDLEVPEALRAALTSEAAAIAVAPATTDGIRQRGRRRKRRRRGLAVAAALLVLAAAAGVVDQAVGSHRDDEHLRTVEERFPDLTGTAPQPLLVLGIPPGQSGGGTVAEPFDGLSQVDELSASGERTPWWHREEGSDWGVGFGVELVDGRRFGLAVGGGGTPEEGRYAIAEISESGTTIDQHVLDLPAVADDEVASAHLIGASGSRLVVGFDVEERRGDEPPVNGSAAPTWTTTVYAYDLRTGSLEPLRSGVELGTMAVGGDALVELSRTDGCTLLVHADLGAGPTREVGGACTDDRLAVTELDALSPDGRYAVVTRLIVTSGAPEEALLVVDLDEGAGAVDGDAREVLRATSPVAIDTLAWTGPRTVSAAVITDDPQFADILPLPATARGATPDDPTVVAVPYRQRS